MKKKLKKLFILLLVSYIGALILVDKVGKKLNPVIQSYSTIEAERLGNYMINQSLDKKFMSQLDTDIFTTEFNDNGEIQMIDFKQKEVNILLEKTSSRIQKNLIKLENGDINSFEIADTFRGLRFKKIRKGVVCEIPEGTLYSNVLLSNLGPVIPIKLTFIGQVVTNIKTKVQSYGINSVYLEVYVHVELKERVSMPLRTKEMVVTTDIPLAIKIIQGNIPNYYQNPIYYDSSEFSLPIQ